VQPLNLDFLRTKSTSSRIGLVLLLLAAGVSAKLYNDYVRLVDETESADAKVARLERQAGHKPVKENRSSKSDGQVGQEIKRANEVVQHLSLPWDQLFKAIESSSKGQVALLSILPDEKKGIVNISGEAKNPAAMLDYVRRLEHEKTFFQVHLLNHQVEEQDPQTPVRFSLVATWQHK
jgi:hypothetical protein